MVDILLGLLLLAGILIFVGVVLLIYDRSLSGKVCCGDPLAGCFPTENSVLLGIWIIQDGKKVEFPWDLQGGDGVFWHDPEGACSRFIVIRGIEFHGRRGDPDCVVRISGTDGDFLECLAKELS